MRRTKELPFHYSDTLCPSAGRLSKIASPFHICWLRVLERTRISTRAIWSIRRVFRQTYVRLLGVSHPIATCVLLLLSRVRMDSHLKRSRLYDVDDERWYLFWEGGSFLGRSADRTRGIASESRGGMIGVIDCILLLSCCPGILIITHYEDCGSCIPTHTQTQTHTRTSPHFFLTLHFRSEPTTHRQL